MPNLKQENKVSLSINREIIKKAKELGLNISKTCEIALLKKIQLLEQGENPRLSLPEVSFTKENSMADRVGFEPTTSSLEGASFGKTTVDWTAFRNSLKGKYRGSYETGIFTLSMQYYECLLKRDLSKVKLLSVDRAPRVLRALSALAKFLGMHQEYLALIKSYGLSWTGRSKDDYVIDRLTMTNDPEEIWDYIRTVKQFKPEFSLFMDFLTVTGLRYSEAVHSYNLIIQLTKEGSLTEKYLNIKTGFLEHFRFKETFIRNCKKAFVSFALLELIDKIGKSKPMPRDYVVKKHLTRHNIPQRFKAIRSLNATFMIKYLKEVEIDLLQGRTNGSVFRTHYVNLSLITDLKARLNQAQRELLDKINIEKEQKGILLE